MRFSLPDYNEINSVNAYFFPENFFCFIPIDKKKYKEQEDKHIDNNNTCDDSFHELHKRVGNEYYRKVYPAQSSALSFSERTFPSYRFLLPEILADDWLAIVGWHKKHSRDHALHQPLTAYIVYKLLKGGLDGQPFQIGGRSLLDLCVDKIFLWEKTDYIKEYLLQLGVKNNDDLFNDIPISRLFWKSLFFETAMVAAIFHDIGYPWQYINRINKNLNVAEFTLNNSLANAEHILHCFKNRLILYPFNGYKSLKCNTPCNWENSLLKMISESLTETHGFSGSLGFLHLNDHTKEFPSKKELPFHNFCIEWAALGIMMHDLKDIYHGKDKLTLPDNNQMRLEFDRDPLSCIITLADVLQEFARPNVNFHIHEDGSEFTYPNNCLSSELIYENGNLNLIYYYSTNEGMINKQLFIPKEEKEYFDLATGYFDFSSVGISNIEMSAMLGL